MLLRSFLIYIYIYIFAVNFNQNRTDKKKIIDFQNMHIYDANLE